MRTLLLIVLVWTAAAPVVGDEFVENCKSLLALPALRERQQQDDHAFSKPYGTKLNRMRIAVTYLRGEQRVTDQELASIGKRVADTERTLIKTSDDKVKERTQKRLERYRESLRQAQFHRQLDMQTKDREARAKAIEGRIEELQAEQLEKVLELRQQHREELAEESKKLSRQWEAYKKELANYYKAPPGEFSEAKVTGYSENQGFLMFSRSYQKEGKPQVLVRISLLGRRVLPGNHQEYRDGIKSWTSSFGKQSTVLVNVGAFETGVTVLQKDVDRDTLNQLIDGWLELEKLRDFPLPGGHD